jgi:hydrogenase nickel incorporation protein HypB
MTNAANSPRIVELRRGILKKNDEVAAVLRSMFLASETFVVNVVSAPGTGKTRLLEETMRRLISLGWSTAALVGDPETDNDAQRLRRSGASVNQIITRGVCHLEASMVADAYAQLFPPLDSAPQILFVENVGNLVCTTSYDLGESLRVVMISVTEGEDKPLKYPGLFNSADIALITKCDLADACDCDLASLRNNIDGVRPGICIVETSAKTGQGVDTWIDTLLQQRHALWANTQSAKVE